MHVQCVDVLRYRICFYYTLDTDKDFEVKNNIFLRIQFKMFESKHVIFFNLYFFLSKANLISLEHKFNTDVLDKVPSNIYNKDFTERDKGF